LGAENFCDFHPESCRVIVTAVGDLMTVVRSLNRRHHFWENSRVIVAGEATPAHIMKGHGDILPLLMGGEAIVQIWML
jgi:hypothetical protein